MSDHKVIIMALKRGCQLRIMKFISSESYKLAPFLSSAIKQLQITKEPNKLGPQLKGMLGMELHVLNDKTVEGLKRIPTAEVGIDIKRKVTDTRVHTNVKEVVTTLRDSRVCDAEVNKLKALGDALVVQSVKQELLPSCQQAKSESA